MSGSVQCRRDTRTGERCRHRSGDGDCGRHPSTTAAAVAWYTGHAEIASIDPMVEVSSDGTGREGSPADIRRADIRHELGSILALATALSRTGDADLTAPASSLMVSLGARLRRVAEPHEPHGATSEAPDRINPAEWDDQWVTPTDLVTYRDRNGDTRFCAGTCDREGDTEPLGRLAPVDVPSGDGYSCHGCFGVVTRLGHTRLALTGVRSFAAALDTAAEPGRVTVEHVRTVDSLHFTYAGRGPSSNRSRLKRALARRAENAGDTRMAAWGVRVAAALLDDADRNRRSQRAGVAMARRIAETGTLDPDELARIGVDAADGPFVRRRTVEKEVADLLDRAGRVAAEGGGDERDDAGFVRLNGSGTAAHPGLWLLAATSGDRRAKRVAGHVHSRLTHLSE